MSVLRMMAKNVPRWTVDLKKFIGASFLQTQIVKQIIADEKAT